MGYNYGRQGQQPDASVLRSPRSCLRQEDTGTKDESDFDGSARHGSAKPRQAAPTLPAPVFASPQVAQAQVIIPAFRAAAGSAPTSGGVGLENFSSLAGRRGDRTCTCGYESAGEREGENNHAQTKRIYLNRAFGGDRYYCVIDGDLDAGTATGKGAG